VLEGLPRLGIALTFVLAGWGLSRLVRLGLHRYLLRRAAAVKSAFDEAGIEMPSPITALDTTPRFEAALHPSRTRDENPNSQRSD